MAHRHGQHAWSSKSRREERRIEAKKRKEERESRTAEEQIKLIKERRGSSFKELKKELEHLKISGLAEAFRREKP